MRNDDRDRIESLLDNALAIYARQTPRPGLEGRVLDRIHVGAGPRRVLPRWVWVVPAAACLLGVGILWTRHVTPAPQRVPVTPVVVVREIAPPTLAASRMVARPHKRKALPRLPQFPAPLPVTNQERALLAFVAHAPKEAQEALIDARLGSIEPIRIEEIKIQPLE